jgi:dolichyl-phosphate beta-glucosyltransferase
VGRGTGSAVRLSVVVPAFNEEKRIVNGLADLMAVLDAATTEIVVVDDGSTDDTVAVATKALEAWPRSTVLSLASNAGKGAAVKAGVIAAQGATIAFMDADMSTDLRDFELLLSALESSHVAIGSRSHEESDVVRRPPVRALMNRMFGMLVASTTTLPYMDTQCGFKAFRGPVAKLLFHGLTVERFGFDAALLDLATRLGLAIEAVPVHWSDVGGSHVEPIRHGSETALEVLKMRLSWDRIPPLLGVAFEGMTPAEVGEELDALLTATDLVVAWGTGAAVLLPCETPSAAHRRIVEMTTASSRSTTMLDVPYQSLLAPRFGSFERPMVVGL